MWLAFQPFCMSVSSSQRELGRDGPWRRSLLPNKITPFLKQTHKRVSSTSGPQIAKGRFYFPALHSLFFTDVSLLIIIVLVHLKQGQDLHKVHLLFPGSEYVFKSNKTIQNSWHSIFSEHFNHCKPFFSPAKQG